LEKKWNKILRDKIGRQNKTKKIIKKKKQQSREWVPYIYQMEMDEAGKKYKKENSKQRKPIERGSWLNFFSIIFLIKIISFLLFSQIKSKAIS
jgi:hypothetical protein